VALTAQLEQSSGVLALGFADAPLGAQSLVKASLAEGLSSARDAFQRGWDDWARTLRLPTIAEPLAHQAVSSATPDHATLTKRRPRRVRTLPLHVLSWSVVPAVATLLYGGVTSE